MCYKLVIPGIQKIVIQFRLINYKVVPVRKIVLVTQVGGLMSGS